MTIEAVNLIVQDSEEEFCIFCDLLCDSSEGGCDCDFDWWFGNGD